MNTSVKVCYGGQHYLVDLSKEGKVYAIARRTPTGRLSYVYESYKNDAMGPKLSAVATVAKRLGGVSEPSYADPRPNDGPARLAALFPFGSRKLNWRD